MARQTGHDILTSPDAACRCSVPARHQEDSPDRSRRIVIAVAVMLLAAAGCSTTGDGPFGNLFTRNKDGSVASTKPPRNDRSRDVSDAPVRLGAPRALDEPPPGYGADAYARRDDDRRRDDSLDRNRDDADRRRRGADDLADNRGRGGADRSPSPRAGMSRDIWNESPPLERTSGLADDAPRPAIGNAVRGDLDSGRSGRGRPDADLNRDSSRNAGRDQDDVAERSQAKTRKSADDRDSWSALQDIRRQLERAGARNIRVDNEPDNPALVQVSCELPASRDGRRVKLLKTDPAPELEAATALLAEVRKRQSESPAD